MQGEYHWHKHDDLDEFFYVVEGNSSSISRALGRAERASGIRRAEGSGASDARTEAAVILMVEGAGIVRPAISYRGPSTKSCSSTMIGGNASFSCTVFRPAIPTFAGDLRAARESAHHERSIIAGIGLNRALLIRGHETAVLLDQRICHVAQT